MTSFFLGRVAGACLFVGALSAVLTEASFGQATFLQSGRTPDAVDSDAQSGTDWLARLKAKWPEIEKDSNQQTSIACAGSGISAADLDPKIVYQGSAAVDSATSPNGVVAVADIAKGQVLVFPDGIDRPAVVPTLLGRSLGGGTMSFSNDGRYLAWSGGLSFRHYIYDVSEQRVVSELPLSIAGQQWIGDDLMIEPNSFNSKVDNNSLFLMKRGSAGFVKTVLTDHLYPLNKYGNPDVVGTFNRIARADQLGQSFVGRAKVYTSVADALADNAIVETDVQELSLRTLRLGNFLLQVNLYETAEELRTHRHAIWSLNLLSGASGRQIASRTLSRPWCRPNDIAVAADGKKFAMLVGVETVMIVDSQDLAFKSAYNLLSPPGTMSLFQKIALLPDNRILVTTEDALIVYDPAHPN